MTSSGGTGRPAPNQDVHTQGTRPSDSGNESSAPQSGGRESGPIAAEVLAALRAQEGTPSQSQRSNGKPQAAKSSNGTSSGTSPSERNAPDPAVNPRRQVLDGEQGEQPRGAAAARVATKANRTRQDNTPGSSQHKTPNPWAKPGQAQEAASGGEAPPKPDERPGPVPPPSLVAMQRQDSVISRAAAPPTVPPAPPGTFKPSTAASKASFADTQASLDAVPAAPVNETPPPRPKRPMVSRRSGRVRKARLRLLRVDPWSVMKTAFLLSVALGITLFVAVAVLWSVLDAAGVFDSLDGIITDMTASDTNSGIDINQYIELSRVLGFTTLIAVVDVVLLTALATLGAFLYNLSASLLGGLELTLAEDD